MIKDHTVYKIGMKNRQQMLTNVYIFDNKLFKRKKTYN